jgi:hypothetical protein
MIIIAMALRVVGQGDLSEQSQKCVAGSRYLSCYILQILMLSVPRIIGFVLPGAVTVKKYGPLGYNDEYFGKRPTIQSNMSSLPSLSKCKPSKTITRSKRQREATKVTN